MNQFKIENLYDYPSDTFGIRVTHDYEHKESVELKEGLIMDFDKNNVPVALEILNASKLLGVDKKSLTHIDNIHMKIKISENLILLNLCVSIPFHNKELLKTIEEVTVNDINAPNLETELATI